MELTSLDLSILMEDFKELEDGHVQKVYQRGQELTIEIYIPGDGKERLIVGTSHAFLSKYKRDNPMKPPGFCMELRKHLGKVDKINQRGFDRILELQSGDVKLVCEIFGKGNFILVKEGKIIGALRQEEWADRTIEVGEEYVYPEPTTDPRETDDIFEVLDDGEIVRRLASDLSLGGKYAEEICMRTGIEKTTKIEELTDDEKERIRIEAENLIINERSPILYSEDNMPQRAAPFPLETYEEMEKEWFDQFSEALDEYFYRREKKEEERKKREAYEEKKEGIERQLQQQERKIEGLKRSAEENREKAEIIYENYGTLHEIQKAVEEGVKKHEWSEVREKFEESEDELTEKVKGFNEQERFVTAEVDGKNIKLTLGEDLEAIASNYYDKAKESESKIENAKKAKEETEKQLEELNAESIELEEVMEDKTEKREKKWFEKYRWFHSSEGYLILAGRDSNTNDMLVKKHMESNDLYFHADFDGAPSVVVKEGQDCGDATREEAAKAAVTFAKTWKAGIGADDVYYVDPEQVTENPESGEYLAKGAFVIRGERTYMRNVSVEASIGVHEIDEVKVPMCGPESAIDENCESYVTLKPGHTKKSEIAKKIQGRLDKELDLDYIIRALPPGKSDIKE
ncbi:ribosome rescue protein RqcH [Candidatus Nanohalobium constans]|uniref:Fibronectin-binding domain-containing protein n=1 Tax=Candidatus Nanohalobium constans TaxID=2565781 RepID=A0A5Q0UFU4_9ARCH|nr:ribosome rescue protein RqcH [Candidatus Nanohalobium constans]QGA80070.1 fibronectin-binding domain-containing protein [Candidatus Nanohalobium constans]